MTPAFDDAFICDSVPAELMDKVWAAGWRHFGRYFFRYSSQQANDGSIQTITPLRIDLVPFTLTKSQRRVLSKNAGLRWEIVPAALDDDLRAMFQRHKQRFTHNVPEELETFDHTIEVVEPQTQDAQRVLVRFDVSRWTIR